MHHLEPYSTSMPLTTSKESATKLIKHIKQADRLDI